MNKSTYIMPIGLAHSQIVINALYQRFGIKCYFEPDDLKTNGGKLYTNEIEKFANLPVISGFILGVISGLEMSGITWIECNGENITPKNYETVPMIIDGHIQFGTYDAILGVYTHIDKENIHLKPTHWGRIEDIIKE